MQQLSYLFWIAGGISLCGISFCYPAISSDPAQAQVSSDGTLSTEVTSTDSRNFTIVNGNRAGNNLFHSFSNFSVPTGGSVSFNNASDIQNIINRVTGSSASNIDGLVQANGTANLFLLNPNGIIFGSNASLNVGGSFLASTASSLKFADNSQFSASASQNTSLLTISVPVGLQFGENPGRILVQGNGDGIRTPEDPIVDTSSGLRVLPNQTLALVGGDLELEGGTLKTAGGRIELGSLASPSLVSLTPIGKDWILGYEGVSIFGNIQLSNSTAVDASGTGGGDIQVRGRQVTLTNGSRIEASTLGSESGGGLAINASEFLELTETLALENPSGIFALVYPEATGAGGSLTIETERLALQGKLVQIAASSFGLGNAGSLTIKTGRLSVQNGAQIAASTFDTGNAGALTVTAADLVELSGEDEFPSGLFTQTTSIGTGGKIEIDTRHLIIRNGAVVAAGTGDGSQGRGGNLIVNALDSVEISGTTRNGQNSSGLFARTRGTGTAGNLTITTGQLIIRDRAQVTVGSIGSQSGDAGNLDVTANLIRVENGGKLTATSASGEGGNITLHNLDLLTLRNNSEISTNAAGTGNGGNIDIDTDNLVLAERSNITARAVDGRGGNISITTQGLFVSPDSAIDATSDRGINGIVEIRRPDVDPSAELGILPADVVDVSGLVAQGCSVGGFASGESSFAITGRGGLPPTPAEATRSESVLADLGIAEKSSGRLPNGFGNISRVKVIGQKSKAIPALLETSNKVNPAPLVEATGWVVGSNGEVVLTATVTADTLNIPWFRPHRCNGT